MRLVEHGHGVATGDRVPTGELLEQVGRVPGLAQVLGRLGFEEVPTPAEAASAVEFVLEGLHLTRRLAKDVLDDGRVVYGSSARPDEGPHDPDDRRRRRRDR